MLISWAAVAACVLAATVSVAALVASVRAGRRMIAAVSARPGLGAGVGVGPYGSREEVQRALSGRVADYHDPASVEGLLYDAFDALGLGVSEYEQRLIEGWLVDQRIDAVDALVIAGWLHRAAGYGPARATAPSADQGI